MSIEHPDDYTLDAARARVAAAGGPSLDELRAEFSSSPIGAGEPYAALRRQPNPTPPARTWTHTPRYFRAGAQHAKPTPVPALLPEGDSLFVGFLPPKLYDAAVRKGMLDPRDTAVVRLEHLPRFSRPAGGWSDSGPM